MSQNGNAKNASSSKLWNKPSPQFSLVGNYLPKEIRGDDFPESPSASFKFKCVVQENVCLATKGEGRLFVPSAMLKELSEGACEIEKLHEICAAPGLPQISEDMEDTVSEAMYPSDVRSELKKHHDWYWKCLVDAMKPVADYIPESHHITCFSGTSFAIYPTWKCIFFFCQQEINADLIFRPTLTGEFDVNGKVPATSSDIEETMNYIKTFKSLNHTTADTENTPVIWILDDNIDFTELEQEEKIKCKEFKQIELLRNRSPTSSHGTRIFKFVAATSAANACIHFINIANTNNEVDFLGVVEAFGYIIDCTENKNVVLINCSFSLHPHKDPSVLTEPGMFRYFHEAIHKMGFIIFGAAGNFGHINPHHPWGECSKCIVVGAQNNLNHKIAAFSSGCCGPLVDVITRGTNFAFLMNACWYKFEGTSFSTAILSGACSSIIPHIWTIDDWKTVDEVIKKFLGATTDKMFGCERSHVPMQWKSFNFEKAIRDLVISGKLHQKLMPIAGSSTTSKVDLNMRIEIIRGSIMCDLISDTRWHLMFGQTMLINYIVSRGDPGRNELVRSLSLLPYITICDTSVNNNSKNADTEFERCRSEDDITTDWIPEIPFKRHLLNVEQN